MYGLCASFLHSGKKIISQSQCKTVATVINTVCTVLFLARELSTNSVIFWGQWTLHKMFWSQRFWQVTASRCEHINVSINTEQLCHITDEGYTTRHRPWTIFLYALLLLNIFEVPHILLCQGQKNRYVT